MIYQVNQHKIRYGDIIDFDEDFAEDLKFDFIYSDPPWGVGNLKYWRTINKRNTGIISKEITFAVFLKIIIDFIKKRTKQETIIFLEYGQRWRKEIAEVFNNADYIINGIAESEYGNGNPYDIYIASKENNPLLDNWYYAVKNARKYKTLLAVTEPFKAIMRGKTICDPFCGKGYVARLALDYGMTFYGNEFNEKRLNSTIKILKNEDI